MRTDSAIQENLNTTLILRKTYIFVMLIGASSLLDVSMIKLGLYGTHFLAPMFVGTISAIGGIKLKVHKSLLVGTQGILGCIVAASLSPTSLVFIGGHAFAVLFVVLGTVAAIFPLSLLLARYAALDRAATAWGVIPGAAGVMVALAAERGVDSRIVATMQYLRVIVVVTSASMITSVLGHNDGVTTTAKSTGLMLVHAEDLSRIGGSAVAMFIGIALERLTRLPAAALFGTTAVALLIKATTGANVALPTEVVVIGYGCIGLYVGLQFDRKSIARLARALPLILTATALLTVWCGTIGLAFSEMLGIDCLTGFLASSPGGIDSIAILASSSHANMAIVMMVQTVRFFTLLFLAAPLVRASVLIGGFERPTTQ